MLLHKVAVIGLLGAVGGLTFWFGVMSTEPLPDHRWLHGQNDLLLHALAFGALMIPLVLLVELISAVLIASGAAVVIEVIQMWLPRREPALSDLAAGMAGIGLVVTGTLLTRILASRATRLDEQIK
jgi:VanZ family protein